MPSREPNYRSPEQKFHKSHESHETHETRLSKQFIDTIPRSMSSIREEIRSAASREFSVPQFRVLALIGRKGPCTNSEVADYIGIQPPSMSRLVDGLVKAGYVKREIPASDRRQVRLTLTPKGKARHEDLLATTRETFAGRFAGLTKQKKRDLARGLDVLLEVFS